MTRGEPTVIKLMPIAQSVRRPWKSGGIHMESICQSKFGKLI